MTEVSKITFTIKGPWYSSIGAIIAYCCLLVALIFSLLYFPKKKHIKEKSEIEAKQIIANREKEREIIQLKNKHLQLEIAHKNTELASNTMYLLKFKDLVENVKEPLEKVTKKVKDDELRKELQRINQQLNNTSVGEELWDQFTYYFDQIHINFLKDLRDQFPNLSTNDEKICIYLRMNLSTKEMAQLMNISRRGVEGARYRLRKKLNLDSSISLTDFIKEF